MGRDSWVASQTTLTSMHETWWRCRHLLPETYWLHSSRSYLQTDMGGARAGSHKPRGRSVPCALRPPVPEAPLAVSRSYVRTDMGDARVGSRKRARPVADADPQLSDGRGTIPLERSLVSIDSSFDSSWDDY